ncbi:HutD family protein [Chelatococcus sp. SYSU_G07232]|uniref:HutD family protein n=1 Tax=Chelatococcus albus TaxID=3047466 RepID=A0ABT7AI71_9HYPH|nr:HutD family protein [Chelatococcus sp. SYSU_G07232]MDJ1159080.1 HutD family protein [Chelatococcus sp. SYSU_G07232]
MRIIRSADYRRMPWKNGGGETVEIAVSPPGATLDAFDWRISMAKVAASGPFSLFPGIDRTLAVLDGAGIVLAIDGQRDVRLDRASAPHAFPADVACEGRLVDGGIEDLNVMSRRGALRHRLRRLTLAEPTALAREGDTLAVVTRGAGLQIRADGAQAALAAGDTLVLDGAADAAVEITPEGPAEVYAIDLWRL